MRHGCIGWSFLKDPKSVEPTSTLSIVCQTNLEFTCRLYGGLTMPPDVALVPGFVPYISAERSTNWLDDYMKDIDI